MNNLTGELWIPWSDHRQAWAAGQWVRNDVMAREMCARLNNREPVHKDWRPVQIPQAGLIGG